MAENSPDSSSRRLLLSAQLTEPECLEVGGGAAALFSTPSPVREGANQDAAAVIQTSGGRLLLAVADGVGGQADGDRAAALSLRSLARAFDEIGPDEPLRPRILDAIESANRAICALGTGAATTLAIATIEEGKVRTYHAGDSAVLVIGGRGRIRSETISHSPVGYAVAAGVISEKAALSHPERHLIDNAVGSPDLRIEVGGDVPLSPRDNVLLATDGLLDNVTSEELSRLCPRGRLSVAATALSRLAGQRMREPEAGAPSKPDDLTFILWRPRGA